MTSQKRFIFEVEAAKEATDGKPSIGPVYRSTFAKDGFPNPIDGIDSCWDIFRSVKFCFHFFFIFQENNFLMLLDFQWIL